MARHGLEEGDSQGVMEVGDVVGGEGRFCEMGGCVDHGRLRDG